MKHDFSKSPVNGFYNKRYEEATIRLNGLQEELKDFHKKWVALGEEYKTKPTAENLAKRGEINDKMGEIEDTIKDLVIQIENGVMNLPYEIHEDLYKGSDLGFALGELNGRIYTGRKIYRVPMDHYEDIATASKFDPESDNETNLEDLLTLFNVTEEDSILFDSNILYSQDLQDDDSKTVTKAVEHAHAVMMVNAENKKACEVLRSAKDPVSMRAESLHETINYYLCGKAKNKAVILVNHSGFSKLDTGDEYPLVKRDTYGSFIYRDKYPIQELPDEILPNNNDGSSPVIIGDLSIVRFLVMRDDLLAKDNDLFTVYDRNLKREIIALTTTSDKAYIHGSI